MTGSAYTAREQAALKRQISEDVRSPACPACGGACAVLRTGPRSDVSYVRTRIVVRCSSCLKSLGVDVRRLEE